MADEYVLHLCNSARCQKVIMSNKQAGSALVNSLGALLLASVISAGIYQGVVSDKAGSDGQIHSSEITNILSASRAYHTRMGAWPSSPQDLVNASLIRPEEMATKWGSGYAFSLDGASLQVTFSVPSERILMSVVGAGLPSVTYTGLNVSTKIAPPASPLNSQFYRVDGANAMSGALNAGGFDIVNGSAVYSKELNISSGTQVGMARASERAEVNELFAMQISGMSGGFIRPLTTSNGTSAEIRNLGATSASLSGTVTASKLRSIANASRQIDLSGTSNLNDMVVLQATEANKLTSNNLSIGTFDGVGANTLQVSNMLSAVNANLNANSNFSGAVTVNNLTMSGAGGKLVAPYFYSLASPSYYLSPSSTSQLNRVTGQSLAVAGTTTVTGTLAAASGTSGTVTITNPRVTTATYSGQASVTGTFNSPTASVGGLTVNGVSTVASLYISGASTFSENVSVSGAASVTNGGSVQASTINTGAATVGTLKAASFYDVDNTSYNVQLTGTTKLNSFVTNTLRVTTNAAANATCSGNRMALTSSGDLLICKSGTWSAVQGEAPTGSGSATTFRNNLGGGQFQAGWTGSDIVIRTGRTLIPANKNTVEVPLANMPSGTWGGASCYAKNPNELITGSTSDLLMPDTVCATGPNKIVIYASDYNWSWSGRDVSTVEYFAIMNRI